MAGVWVFVKKAKVSILLHKRWGKKDRKGWNGRDRDHTGIELVKTETGDKGRRRGRESG
jgi:hypothetical protein